TGGVRAETIVALPPQRLALVARRHRRSRDSATVGGCGVTPPLKVHAPFRSRIRSCGIGSWVATAGGVAAPPAPVAPGYRGALEGPAAPFRLITGEILASSNWEYAYPGATDHRDAVVGVRPARCARPCCAPGRGRGPACDAQRVAHRAPASATHTRRGAAAAGGASARRPCPGAGRAARLPRHTWAPARPAPSPRRPGVSLVGAKLRASGEHA